jgi:hypothetical protein
MDVLLTKLFWLKFLVGFLPFYITGVLGGLWRTAKWLIYLGAVALCALFVYSYTPYGLFKVLSEIVVDLQGLGLPFLAGVVTALLLAPPTVRIFRGRRRFHV